MPPEKKGKDAKKKTPPLSSKKVFIAVALVSLMLLVGLGMMIWGLLSLGSGGNGDEQTSVPTVPTEEKQTVSPTPATTVFHATAFAKATVTVSVECNGSYIYVEGYGEATATATSNLNQADAEAKARQIAKKLASADAEAKARAKIVCTTPAPTPTPRSTPRPTPRPTATPTPTPIPSSTPPPSPTPISSPTPTLTPTPIPTPTPTPTPTPSPSPRPTPSPTPTPRPKSVIFEPLTPSGPAPFSTAFRIIIEGGVVNSYQINCGGGVLQGERCLYSSPGTYHPSITVYFADGDVISGNSQVVVH